MTGFLSVITSQTTGYAEAIASCTDSSGNVYVLGIFTNSVTFNNIVLNSHMQSQDLFIVKVSPDLVTYYSTTSIGSDFVSIQASSIFVDSNNNVYIAGFYQGESLTIGNVILPASKISSFVVKLDNNFNILNVNFVNNSQISFITTDNQYVYATGEVISTTNFDNITINPINGSNTFVARLDNQLNWLKVKQIINLTNGGNSGTYLAIYNNSYLYVCGILNSSVECVNTTTPSLDLYNNISRNVYIARIKLSIFEFVDITAAQTDNTLTVLEPKIVLDNNEIVYLIVSFNGSLRFSFYEKTSSATNYEGAIVAFTRYLFPINLLSIESNGITSLIAIVNSNNNLYVAGSFNEIIVAKNKNGKIVFDMITNTTGTFIIKLDTNFNVNKILTIEGEGLTVISDESINKYLYAVGTVEGNVSFGNIQVCSSNLNMFITAILP
ncbi:MAG: hypothetical protein QW478_00065 [Candidatus Micrarchaeaceae archaeon]